MSANDTRDERHIQTSNADQTSDKNGQESFQGEAAPERKTAISLTRLMRLCPQIGDYARNGVGNWADLVAAADLVRSMLGISPDAWRKACAAMGAEAAAITVAVLLERADAIRSPGGYLRDLTRKAERSAFSIYPMLQALERGRT
jgi:replication initiation protein RepC